ncbi:hypothetical protein Ddye_028680 [Dipteronia dyeriana]|uniref:MULE transposase domain-containing protein n=1 Tax=Dipteronia dyeriana TaxID=168575 RepID=A0AAD9WL21_9ROSI|nr:hypothetical protein Ddye_028680 [Dipteronia dyeriana]
MDHLLDQSGSYAAVGHTKKDLQNRLNSVRRSGSYNSDVDSIISYMTTKAEMDLGFFFRYNILKDGSIGNLFWSDAMLRCDYRYFVDVMSFDSTYRTNAYNRSLVIFVGVNNHMKTTVFGFGLLVDETTDTYTWILQTFLEAMHGKYLILVITDGDRAMSKALMLVMGSIVHRLCSWHLERNVQTNHVHVHVRNRVRNTVVEAIEMFGLQNNEWVNSLYGKQTLWAETFLHKTFFGGLQSTKCQRVLILSLIASCTRLKLYEFMSHTDRAMSRIRNNKMNDKFDSINEHPVLVTHLLQLEKHVAKVFTRNTFQWVRDEIKSEAKLSIVNCVDDMKSVLYTFKKFAIGDKTWNVSVMKATNQQHIPETLIMQRWTMIAKDGLELEFVSATTTPNILEIASKMSYYAAKSIESFKAANSAIEKLTIQMKGLLPTSITTREENAYGRRRQSPVHVKDLVIATTKGSKKQNKKSSKKARKYGKCGHPGHTAKTCCAYVNNNISAMAINGDARTGSTSQPTVYADLVQSWHSPYNVNSDGGFQPFAFSNTEVPRPPFTNHLNADDYSMTSSTQATYMQQNQWWRPHTFM